VTKRQADLEALLEYLKRTRGFDFTGYKRASLERRIQKRLQTVGVSSYDDYLDYLEVHPEEFAGLFNTVLINVTSFFRDTATWDYVRDVVVPELLTRRDGNQRLRIWSAGCTSGEEAYTLAMIFAEALGAEEFKERVKIYATDIDEEALAKARQALYSDREVAEIPSDMLAKYFEASEGRFVFRKDLRRHVIFGRHDLIQDAPISRVDMLVCRNTLMYFNAETQAKILSRFQFALNDNAVLFLGRAETLMTHTSEFAPLDLKRRISTKLPSRAGSLRERLLAAANGGNGNAKADGDQARMREIALDGIPSAQLLVDTNGMLVLANERARSLFGIAPTDVLRPLQDLKISYRPVELRSAIDQVTTERRPVVLREVEWPSLAGEVRWLDVHVSPVIDPVDASLLGASVAFNDVSAAKRLQRDLEHAKQELETAYEELQSTNEELETTNEELQSTIEELETTNEELQSTNEELETMNEELQSTNEELQTMNDELRQRSDELNQVNAFLENILTSLRRAVVVVDNDIKVLIWNRAAEELWGLREEEVRGKNLLGLDIGLPTERLKAPVRSALSGAKRHATVTLEAVNRPGHHITCRVTVTPLITRAETIHGVILLMDGQEDQQRRAARDGKRSPALVRQDGKRSPTLVRQDGKRSR
jgi:two-component system CheB/CheR fusion protein